VDAEKHLTIGLLAEDPGYPLQPPVRRTFQEAAARLTRSGHRLVVLPHNATTSGAGLGSRLSFQYYGILPPAADVKPLDQILGEPLVASLAKGVHPVDPTLDLPQRLHELTEARDSYASAWHRLWHAHALDVILAPGAATTAVPHDSYGVLVYTCMWNLIDVSSRRAHLYALIANID
jgi:amidase